jgi:hypothetical protein
MLFACEVRTWVGEKAVIKWDRSSRGDLHYFFTDTCKVDFDDSIISSVLTL